MTQEGTNQEVGKKAPAFEGGRLPGTHAFPFLGDPVYFQCPGTELPLGEVWGFTQTKLGPGLGGFAWLQGTKSNGRMIKQVIRNTLNHMLSSFPSRLVMVKEVYFTFPPINCSILSIISFTSSLNSSSSFIAFAKIGLHW